MAANVTESYGTLCGVSKEGLTKSLAEGTSVTLVVDDRQEKISATVVSMECGANARRFFKVVFEGNLCKAARGRNKTPSGEGVSFGLADVAAYLAPMDAFLPSVRPKTSEA